MSDYNVDTITAMLAQGYRLEEFVVVTTNDEIKNLMNKGFRPCGQLSAAGNGRTEMYQPMCLFESMWTWKDAVAAAYHY